MARTYCAETRAAGQGAEQGPAADARGAAGVGPSLDGGHGPGVQADRARLAALTVHHADGAAGRVDVHGRSASASEIRRPPRYRTVSRARFRMPGPRGRRARADQGVGLGAR